MNYYNEYDAHAAAWLKELIRCGLIPPGVVDQRPIQEVTADELVGFTQCHFFAGIGGWSLALAIAGWSPSRPVWTGSCPCQPFSVAGRGLGTADERHLWPHFRRLIADGKPATVLGEQVASKDGRHWLSGVRSDLEAMGYAVGAADLCAAGVGAEEAVVLADGTATRLVFGPPHIRQRLFWLADSPAGRLRIDRGSPGSTGHPDECCASSRLGNPRGAGCGELRRTAAVLPEQPCAELSGGDSRVSDSPYADGWCGISGAQTGVGQDGERRWGSAVGGDWHDTIWIPCADGKARRIKPGLAPLVNGLPGRVGLVRGFGNAIVPEVAAQIIDFLIDK